MTYGVHNTNVGNGLRAVMERVFFVKSEGGFARPPRPAKGSLLRTLGKFKARLVAIAPSTAPISREQFLDCYQGRKRKTYENAVESLHARELTRVDSYLTAFVKAEKINFTDKGDPAPRLIQPRSPRFNVEVGCFIKPMEPSIYRSIDSLFGAPVVAKGRNAVQRGTMLEEAWSAVDNPVAIFLDASRFDQHVSFEALTWEHSVYTSMCSDPRLRKLLSWQLVNRGFVNCEDGRVKYSVEGCRASGDMNTALGNVLIMCAMMWTYLREHAPGSRLINDGDDCVVIVQKHHLTAVLDSAKPWFLKLGFSMKVEGFTDVFERIEFCQAQPVWSGVHSQHIMVRDPRLALAKDNISVRPVNDLPTWERQTKAISECGLALAGDMPLYGAFYQCLTNDREVQRELNTGMDYLARGLVGSRVAPTARTRVSFYLAFDITPDEQEALECYYDTITPRFAPGAPRDIERDTTEVEILRIARN